MRGTVTVLLKKSNKLFYLKCPKDFFKTFFFIFLSVLKCLKYISKNMNKLKKVALNTPQKYCLPS